MASASASAFAATQVARAAATAAATNGVKGIVNHKGDLDSINGGDLSRLRVKVRYLDQARADEWLDAFRVDKALLARYLQQREKKKQRVGKGPQD